MVESATLERDRLYELDKVRSDILTSLDLADTEKETFETVRHVSAEQQNLDKVDLEYYKQLQKNKQEINITFTGTYHEQMSVLKNDILLVYDRGLNGNLYRREDAPWLLNQEYTLYVTKVDEVKRIVYLSIAKDQISRGKACQQIDAKLEAGEAVYLRGQIVELQRSAGEYGDRLSAYVNINGLGILGIIPIGKWCSGYKSVDDFRDQVSNNIGSIVSFRVLKKTMVPGRGLVYLCDRRDYLKKAGCDPWLTLARYYRPKQTVKVKVVSRGKSEGSYFSCMEGLPDLNFLTYIHDKSSLTDADIKIGGEYYGFIQKMDADKKFCRVRLTECAKEAKTAE